MRKVIKGFGRMVRWVLLAPFRAVWWFLRATFYFLRHVLPHLIFQLTFWAIFVGDLILIGILTVFLPPLGLIVLLCWLLFLPTRFRKSMAKHVALQSGLTTEQALQYVEQSEKERAEANKPKVWSFQRDAQGRIVATEA